MGYCTTKNASQNKTANITIYTTVSQTLFLEDPFWFLKITTDHHILADVNTDCPDDKHLKLKIYISEMILDRY